MRISKIVYFFFSLIIWHKALALGPQNTLLEGRRIMPIREHSIIVTREHMIPDRIMLFEGERLRIFLTATQEQGGCLIVDSHNVFLGAVKGEVTSIELIFFQGR